MTGPADRVDELVRALEQTSTVIGGIGSVQHHARTPCRSWDVAHLVDHLLTDVSRFSTMVRGEDVDWSAPHPAVPAADWRATFDQRAAELVAAWRDVGPNPSIDMQIAELAVHGWDLEVATGQDVALDPSLAETGLAWMRGMMKDEYRGTEADGKSFGPEVDAPADADAYVRLASFSGRSA